VSAPPERWVSRLAPGQVVTGWPSLVVWWADGDPVRLPVADVSSARMDSGQAARRSASFLVPSAALPPRVGPIARVCASLVLQDGPGMVSEVVQLVGQLADGPQDDEPGLVRLDVASREQVLLGHGLTAPRTLATSAMGSLLGLVREALPGEGVDCRGVADVSMGALDVAAGERARWDAITQLAATLGADFGATRGGSLRLAPIESDSAVGDSADSWVVRRAEPLPRLVCAPQPNVYVVTGRDMPDDDGTSAPAGGVAIDDRPASPYFVGSGVVRRYSRDPRVEIFADAGYPLRTRFLELPVMSAAAAMGAARAAMLRGERQADISITVPWNPWADWGDRLVVFDASGQALSLIVTGLDPLPLIPDPQVTVTGRLE